MIHHLSQSHIPMACKADQVDISGDAEVKPSLGNVRVCIKLGPGFTDWHQKMPSSWPILISACIASIFSSSHNFAYFRHHLCSRLYCKESGLRNRDRTMGEKGPPEARARALKQLSPRPQPAVASRGWGTSHAWDVLWSSASVTVPSHYEYQIWTRSSYCIHNMITKYEHGHLTWKVKFIFSVMHISNSSSSFGPYINEVGLTNLTEKNSDLI